MTTSGTTNSTLTAQEVVQTALEQMGVVSAGEIADGDDLEVGIRHLNLLLKSFTARGANLWRDSSVTVTIPANMASLQLAQGVEQVTSARVTQPYERELFQYDRGQYKQIPNKSAPGVPTAFYLDRQRDQATIYVWPVPRNDTPIILDTVRVIEDVTEGTQTIDVPQKWLETVAYALAARLAPIYGLPRTDPATAQLVATRAQAFEQVLLDEDRPTSIYMGSYDSRGYF